MKTGLIFKTVKLSLRQLFHVAAAVTPWPPKDSTPSPARLPGFKFLYVSLLILACLLAGGCAMGPKFQKPEVDMPGGFLGQGVVSAPAVAGQQSRLSEVGMADLPWWDVFDDDTLRELVKTALTNNCLLYTSPSPRD